MIYSILAGAAVASEENIPLDEKIIALLDRLEPTPGRLHPIPLPNGAVLLRDNFKGHLETAEAALDTLAQFPARRRIVVLGEVEEPPSNQTAIYRNLGEKAARSGSQVILMASGRAVRVYLAGAIHGGLPREALTDAGTDFHAAVDLLRRADLGPGDVVLIKGRSTQRLGRIPLALQGRTVRCNLVRCSVRLTD